ncbi:MAG TPA: hypothetical protein VFK02_06855 [Kofleriaceae bacterium]|nr:hypothetical protein [Kofleriaceae bacterium]
MAHQLADHEGVDPGLNQPRAERVAKGVRRHPLDAGALARGAEIGAGVRPRSQHRPDPARGRHTPEGGGELRIEVDGPVAGGVLGARDADPAGVEVDVGPVEPHQRRQLGPGEAGDHDEQLAIGDVLAELALGLVGLEVRDALRHPLRGVERGEQLRELVVAEPPGARLRLGGERRHAFDRRRVRHPAAVAGVLERHRQRVQLLLDRRAGGPFGDPVVDVADDVGALELRQLDAAVLRLARLDGSEVTVDGAATAHAQQTVQVTALLAVHLPRPGRDRLAAGVRVSFDGEVPGQVFDVLPVASEARPAAACAASSRSRCARIVAAAFLSVTRVLKRCRVPAGSV